MNTPDDFSDYYRSILDDGYDCVDRIVVNGYFPMGQTPGGFRVWWQGLFGTSDNLNDTCLMRMAGRFSRRVRGWAKSNNVPVIYCEPGQRKHEIAEKHLPTDTTFSGVFLILVSKAPALVWEARRFGKGGLDLKRKNPWPYVNHYSFHMIDPQWGHVTIKISGHPPFGAMIILNGHEWVERQSLKHGIEVSKEGNCFTDSTDMQALDKIADTLNSAEAIGRLSQVCDRWIYSACLCFGLSLDDQQRSAFHYVYSVFQLEYSRNLLFRRGTQLDEIYQAVIDRTRRLLDVPTLKTIFGSKRRPFQHRHSGSKSKSKHEQHALRCQVTVENPTHDLTVIKIRFGNLTLKIYDKGARLLRIEATAHNSKDLRCGKLVSNLPRLISALRDMTIRFLNVLRYTHIASLDQGELDRLPQPTQCGSKRIAGIDISKPRMQTLVQSLAALAAKPGGFTLADLRAQVRKITGMSQEAYTARNAAYDLVKIQAKEMVQRIPHSRRYLVVPKQFQSLIALLILREKVIKPVLSAICSSPSERIPNNPDPLDKNYEALRTSMSATLATLGIAA